MDRGDQRKRHPRSNRADGYSTGLAPGAGGGPGAGNAPDVGVAAAGGAPSPSAALGSSGPPIPRALAIGGSSPRVPAADPWWPAASFGTSDWILRHEKKWSTYVKKQGKEKDKSSTPNLADVVNVDDASKQRPTGHKKAKDERNGKRKEPVASVAITDKLDKFIEASTKAEKMAEIMYID
ncbi:hypothetical protein E2562_005290 [Oryza meyeriana var. granulata]|uniref:No apical meristem-associated C-terminal domain-containing protein n=1 Tax=Oryza meyeriana var. granulata TaxID=110450 RepID=A0A6G1EEZ7_9ORYZ|nr:hypothetical protein E2562_005290 [Oryza meyeriana var. granulata]